MKNLLLKIIILMLCLLALLLGTACTEPEAPAAPPAEVPAEPTVIESSEFLPEPDEIVVWRKGGNIRILLREEQKEEIYRLFCEMMQYAEGCLVGDSDDLLGENTVFTFRPIEFIYYEQHRYVVPADGSEAIVQVPFEYEGVLFPMVENVGDMIALRWEEHISRDMMTVSFSSEAYQFQKKIDQIVSQCINESLVGPHPDVDPEPVETKVFVERPNSMRLINQGEVKNLTTEQQEDLYNAFGKMMDSLAYISVLRTPYYGGYSFGYFDNDDYICLEFLYDQRQRYVGEKIQPSDDEYCFSISSFEFDSIIFVISDEFPMVFIRKDGQYYGLCETSWYIQLWIGNLDFCDMIKELAV